MDICEVGIWNRTIMRNTYEGNVDVRDNQVIFHVSIKSDGSNGSPGSLPIY